MAFELDSDASAGNAITCAHEYHLFSIYISATVVVLIPVLLFLTDDGSDVMADPGSTALAALFFLVTDTRTPPADTALAFELWESKT